MILKKDNERNNELLNMKKAWETLEAGRAEKAMKTRQKFLDSLRPKTDDQLIVEIPSETESIVVSTPPVIEKPQPQHTFKQHQHRKKSPSLKKISSREESPKPIELIVVQPQIDEPLLHEPPPSSTKPKTSLPPLDLKAFIK